jgi:hypothetical protein
MCLLLILVQPYMKLYYLTSVALLGGYHILWYPLGPVFIKQLIKGCGYHFFPKIYMPHKGINCFNKKTSFQFAGCQNFENNWFSFAGSQKLHITY